MDHKPIDRPEVFFRQLHPVGVRGSIVLRRKLNGSKHHSQILPEDAEKLFRLSCLVPDLSFSAATFKGMPLLINFESTNCLFAQFPSSAELNRKLYQLVQDKGFSVPTFVVDDGERLTAFWVLRNPITRLEYHKVFLLQQGLLLLLSELRPFHDSLAVNTLVPLIGTTNSKSDRLVGIPSYSSRLLDNGFAERFLTRYFGISAADELTIHSRAILELLSLLHHRIFVADTPTEDWLLFFGASLCHFCGKDRLIDELRALCESLKGQSWRAIQSEYSDFIRDLATTAMDGYVRYGQGCIKSIDDTNWFNTMAGKLEITQAEVNALGLEVVISDRLDPAMRKLDINAIQPVGMRSFIPIERLLMKAA
jgi:hypothetical protein